MKIKKRTSTSPHPPEGDPPTTSPADPVEQTISLTVETEFAKIDTKKGTMRVLAQLRAAADAELNRSPLDLVLVLDKSGSMAGESKIGVMLNAAGFVLENLVEGDKVSIVSFDTQVNVDLPLTEMNDENRAAAKKVLRSIKAGSCTNLSGGLADGFAQLKKNNEKHPEHGNGSRVQSVLLFTDGHANVGIQRTDQLQTMISKFKDNVLHQNITVNTFGFGNDHSADMLAALAETANGGFYFLANKDQIATGFADALGTLLSVTAQNVRVRLESGTASVAASLNELRFDDKTSTWTVGDMYAEAHKDVLFEVSVPAVKSDGSYTLGELVVEYFDVSACEQRVVRCGIEQAREKGAKEDVRPESMQLAIDRRVASEALGRAAQLQADGKAAKKVLEEAKEKLHDSPLFGKHEENAAYVADLDLLAAECEQKSWSTFGQKIARKKKTEHCQQRSAISEAPNAMYGCVSSSATTSAAAPAGYDNMFRKQMRSKAQSSSTTSYY